MCTAIAKRTKKLDARDVIKFVSFRDHDIVKDYQLVKELQGRMEQRLYILQNNKWHNGIDSVYILAKAVPSYWFAVPFIKLSMLLGLGNRVYDYIANHRKLVPVGQCRKEVC
jgi:predicted DCC family thiol-disulfide oxidoreductase YuxK